MATLDCNDRAFLQYTPYWLLHYSWHWVLFLIYLFWWEKSMNSERPHLNPGRHAIHWLEKQGYLHSQNDARYLILFHLILLILESFEGYWILTGWYQLLVPGWRMTVHDRDWRELLGKVFCMFYLLVGICVFLVVGMALIISTLVHIHPRVVHLGAQGAG